MENYDLICKHLCIENLVCYTNNILCYNETFLVTLYKLMELLGPGGSLERFNYEKLPRVAQYEVIKEVLWAAYQVNFFSR